MLSEAIKSITPALVFADSDFDRPIDVHKYLAASELRAPDGTVVAPEGGLTPAKLGEFTAKQYSGYYVESPSILRQDKSWIDLKSLSAEVASWKGTCAYVEHFANPLDALSSIERKKFDASDYETLDAVIFHYCFPVGGHPSGPKQHMFWTGIAVLRDKASQAPRFLCCPATHRRVRQSSSMAGSLLRGKPSARVRLAGHQVLARGRA